jgi:flagellar hook-associated protein 2
MVSSVNLHNISVDKTGRVTVSGAGSNIDWNSALDQVMTARRLPVDRIETQVKTNTDKITAIKGLRTLVGTLKDSLSTLRGAVSLGDVSNAFKSRQTFTSTSRADGATPSAAGNLMGVSVTNSAALGSHTLDILRVAKAHKVGSGAFTSLTSDLGTARGLAANSVSGSFTINGTTISVLSTDTILDVRDRINNANTGTTATGVSASVVSVSSTEHYLVLTKDATGTSMTLGGEVGSVLSKIGVSADGGTTYSNELQKAQTARFKADGLLDPDRFESDLVLSSSTPMSTFATSATYPGSFDIVGSGTATINYTAATTLSGLASLINLQTGTTAVSASVVADGSGSRLVLTRAGGAAFTLTDTSGLLGDLGVDNTQVIERPSNTVGDLWSGVTLSLYGAEESTKIKIDVDPNYADVTAKVNAFVTAYNDVKKALNTHQYLDPTTGQKTDATGVLFGTKAVTDVASQLSAIIGGGIGGVSSAFSSLAQIGVTLVNNNTVTDPLLKNTLEVNSTKLGDALLKNPDDVRRLFSFDFTTSDSRFTLLNFTGTTAYNSSGYTLNIGNLGAAQKSSRTVTSSSATLNDGVNSVGATISGSFQLNGTAINYNVTTDTLATLATTISAAGITGVSASVVSNKLQITSTTNPISISGDSGDLVAALVLTTDEYLVGRANIGGAAAGTDNGTVTIAKRALTATNATGAQGLQLLYTGNTDVSGVTIGYTVGFAAQMYFAADKMLTDSTGVLDAEIQSLEDQNKFANTRSEEMLARLDLQRHSLADKFQAAEKALSVLTQTQSYIDQFVAAQNKN